MSLAWPDIISSNTCIREDLIPWSRGNGPLSGFDSLLATAQMPTGVPVATVAIDGALDEAVKRERKRCDLTADEALAKLNS